MNRSIALLLLMLGWPAWADTNVTVGTDASRHVLKGKLVTPEEVLDGEVVIQGDRITCAAADCPDPAGATVYTVREAYIFPGFIDAHNHVAYNFLDKWTPPKLYKNRGQWQSAKSYKDFKEPYKRLKDDEGLFCEMVKYGEVKALLSGITTIQGIAPSMNCFRTLIRNAENQNELNLNPSHVRTFILDIQDFKGSINWSVTKSFVVHLSEGIDEKSRGEFDTLKQKGMLTAQTAIIHGTAFGEAEFREVAQAGAKLIWSPRSNLVLYGKTTDVRLARKFGVPVSLGVDWNPSGSDNVFDELRVAEKVNREEFGGAIPNSEWIRLVTVNPARALALDQHLGKLAAGSKADITVVKAKDAEPNASLLKNGMQDVEMVWVGGELLYGDASILAAAKPAQGCEPIDVCGVQKRVCIVDTKNQVPKSDQTLAGIEKALKAKQPVLAPLARCQ